MANSFYNNHEELLSYIDLLISGENNIIAKMANVAAVLKNDVSNWLWVGFYLVDKEKYNQLVLGPFQGQIASFRENYNQGVLGRAWNMQKPIVIENIGDFCEEVKIPKGSQSQIAIPIIQQNKVVGVFSIFSANPNDFDKNNIHSLERIVNSLVC